MNTLPERTRFVARGAFLDAVLNHLLATIGPGWIMVQDCALPGDGTAPPARVRYALVHAQFGIALLDVLPDPAIPRAADRLRSMLDAAGFTADFGADPPIVYLCMPTQTLRNLGDVLDAEFARQPPLALRGGSAWVEVAQRVLEGRAPARPREAALADAARPPAPPVSTPPETGRPAGRRGLGLGLLVGLSGLAALILGGMLVQHRLGPQAQPAADRDPARRMAAGVADGPAGLPVAASMPAAVVPVSAPSDAAGRETDRAVPAALPGPEPTGPAPAMAAEPAIGPEGLTVPAAPVAGHDIQMADLAPPSEAMEQGVPHDVPPAGGSDQEDGAQQPATASTTSPEPPAPEVPAREEAATAVPAPESTAEATPSLPAGSGAPDATPEPVAVAPTSTAAPAASDEPAPATPDPSPPQPARSEAASAAPAPAGTAEVPGQAQARPGEDLQEAWQRALSERDRAILELQRRLEMLERSPAAGVTAANLPPPASPAAVEPGQEPNAAPPGPPQTETPPEVAATPASPTPDTAPPDPAAGPVEAALSRDLPTLSPAMLRVLVRRGDEMARMGDISAARLFYKRAAAGGSAQAATAAGRMHDPIILAEIGVRDIRPDAAEAAAWYRRGMAMGDNAAEGLLRRLEAQAPAPAKP